MFTTYQRLYSLNTDGERHTSYRKKASFETVCARGSIGEENEDADDVDAIFGNEPARQDFRAFRKFKAGSEQECGTTKLVRLDAAMTTTIDSLRKIVNHFDTSHNCPLANGTQAPSIIKLLASH